jgi:hypothetical protein
LLAPDWGEFYEVTGDLRLERLPSDSWVCLADPPSNDTRHFLFYFKDETFECDASGWSFTILPAVGDVSAGWQRVQLSPGSSVIIVPPRSKSSETPAIADLSETESVPSSSHSWIWRALRKWFD